MCPLSSLEPPEPARQSPGCTWVLPKKQADPILTAAFRPPDTGLSCTPATVLS